MSKSKYSNTEAFAEGVKTAMAVLAVSIQGYPVSMRRFIELCRIDVAENYEDMYKCGGMVVTNFIEEHHEINRKEAKE